MEKRVVVDDLISAFGTEGWGAGAGGSEGGILASESSDCDDGTAGHKRQIRAVKCLA